MPTFDKKKNYLRSKVAGKKTSKQTHISSFVSISSLLTGKT